MMSYLLLITKLILFWLSLHGYAFLLIQWLSIPSSFSFILTISFQVLLLTFAGFLNVLSLTSTLLLAAGLSLFIYFLRKKRKDFLSHFIAPCSIWLIVIFSFVILYLRGKYVLGYDNFSHWALVAKSILSTDRFPSFQDPIIVFKSYPLGSSTYIYYYCRFIGQQDNYMMAAQALISLAALLPFFEIKKNNHFLNYVIISIITFSSLTFISSGLTSLIVDALLPIICISTWIILDSLKAKPILRSILLVPMGTLLVLTKNSGMFFYFILLLFHVSIIVHTKQLQKVKWHALWSFLPLMISFLWSKHVEYVFDKGLASKHSFSIENYTKTFSEKNFEDASYIAKRYLSELFIDRNFYILLGFIVFFIIVSLWNKKSIKYLVGTVLLITIIFLAYNLGTYSMYIFSMPLNEAVILGGFNRYMRSIYLFLYLLICKELMNFYPKESYDLKSILQVAIIVFVALIIMTQFFPHYKSMLFFGSNLENTQRQQLELLFYDNTQFKDGEAILFLTTVEDFNYVGFMIRYITMNTSVGTQIISSSDELIASGYTHIIVLELNELTNRFLENNKINIPNGAPFILPIQD